jgi:hypothetical protein
VSDSGAYTFISVGVDLGVGTLTLNRPDKLNAFTAEMVEEAFSALGTLVKHPDVRAILVTGAGHGFSAGADVDELRQVVEKGDADLGRRLVDGARALGNYLPEMNEWTAKERLQEFEVTGADLLITACPYCQQNFRQSLPAKDKNRVMDLVELVDELL